MYVNEYKCKNIITNGIFVRYIITIIALYYLSMNLNIQFINKNIYLILPFLLTFLDSVDNIFTITILDSVDNIFTFFNNYKKTLRNCASLYYYQYQDKICDSISYLLLFVFFKLNNGLLFFILYRIIGVILFCITKDNKWLIIFFDFVKEYLLYYFIFGNNNSYIFIFILLKINFEYYLHPVEHYLPPVEHYLPPIE